MRLSAASTSASTCSEFSFERGVASRLELLDLVVAIAEVRDRGLHTRALLEQLGAKTIDVDAHQRRSFRLRSPADPEADDRRRSASAGPTPVSSTILSRAAVSRDERQCAARHREHVGEQPEHRVVRASVLGRRGDADLPGLAVPADDRSTAGTGTHAQPQAGHPLSVCRALCGFALARPGVLAVVLRRRVLGAALRLPRPARRRSSRARRAAAP